MTPFTVVGTPGDRRVLGFAAACRAEGLAEPRVVPWTALLRGTAGPVGPGLLRIDSPGEDPCADELLRGPGDPARVGGGSRWHSTFVAALTRLSSDAHPGTVWLNDPGDLAVLFDKRRCHARLRTAGVPVPESLPGVSGYSSLRAAMRDAGWSRVFVKPAHGSSASGVVALEVRGAAVRCVPGRGRGLGPADARHLGRGLGSGGRVRAVSSAVRGEYGEYVNSLRVATYEREADVAALIDALAPDGLHVERWIPKAGVDGRVFDLRVVVIDGTPAHAVVRTSRTPMTNLHLGGRRGDLERVRAVLGETGWHRVLDVCARAAACFPGSLTVGVDLLVAIGLRRFLVGEVNAFGDLLPGLTGLPGGPGEGLDTYTTQVRAAISRNRASCTT
jgi:glutathione synthase/RimK-type ligase-like ATP-grasp enzyme